jgi:hypothetical protein
MQEQRSLIYLMHGEKKLPQTFNSVSYKIVCKTERKIKTSQTKKERNL